MTKKAAVILLGLSLVLILAGVFLGVREGWGFSAGAGTVGTEGDLDPQKLSAIRIDVGGVYVRIYDTEDDTVQVDVSERVKNDVTVEKKNGVLTVRQSSSNSIQLFGGERSVVVWVPDNFAGEIAVTTGSGEIVFMGLALENVSVALTSGSGEISLYDCTLREAHLQTDSGDIYTGDVAAEKSFTAVASSGALSIRTVYAPEISAGTSSGDLWISETGGDDLQLKTVSGNILADRVDAVTMTARAESGSVDLLLSGTAADYTITAASASGSIRGAEGSGGGDRRVEISTASGNISVSYVE